MIPGFKANRPFDLLVSLIWYIFSQGSKRLVFISRPAGQLSYIPGNTFVISLRVSFWRILRFPWIPRPFASASISFRFFARSKGMPRVDGGSCHIARIRKTTQGPCAARFDHRLPCSRVCVCDLKGFSQVVVRRHHKESTKTKAQRFWFGHLPEPSP